MKCETCNKTSDNEDDFAYPFAHEPDYCWDCFELTDENWHSTRRYRIDWEKHGEYVDDTPGTRDGVERWVCNYCEKDFPLDLNTDILPHLQEDHEDVLDAVDKTIAKGEILK